MSPLLSFLVHPLPPLLGPLCFVTAWTLVLLVLGNLWTTTRDGVETLKRLHQIPCANCQFFTGDYHLKCTVHPSEALSEAAISCLDYWPKEKRV